MALWLGLLGVVAAGLGVVNAVAVLLLPTALGAAFGVYLFYAQHHFPSAHVRPTGEWEPVDAALHASSFLELPRWLHWFTGNIAYHHVHHVNHQIPFYRLPEVMAALPELQSPGRTSLRPRDVWACFGCNVWDPDAGRLVSFAEAERAELR